MLSLSFHSTSDIRVSSRYLLFFFGGEQNRTGQSVYTAGSVVGTSTVMKVLFLFCNTDDGGGEDGRS